jgi:hypothetical protein
MRSPILLLTCLASRAWAGVGDPDAFALTRPGALTLDAGLFVGFPEGLTTGLSTGIGAGVTRQWGAHWAYGARASWSTDTESSEVWTVTQSDTRLRATGALQQVAGRGTFALRLGLGATVVHEVRDRNDGARVGLMGGALEVRALDALPAADLDAVITLHVAGAWMMSLSAGPSLDRLDGDAHWAWTSELGIAWQP